MVPLVFGIFWHPLPTSYEDDSDFNKTSDQETNIVQNKILSPILQIESGVNPEDVECEDGYVLVVRDFGKNRVACILSENIQKFEGFGAMRDKSLCKKHIDLKMSSLDGIGRLTIGFFLNGTDNRCMKHWDFGDGQKRGSVYNIIENHQYDHDFDGKPYDRYTFHGHVNVTDPYYDPNRLDPIIQRFNVTVLKNPNEIISNVNQLQAVVVQGDSVGFSISTKNIKSKTKWTFEEQSIQSQPYRLAEHYKYNKVGIINGNVTVWPDINHPDPDYLSEYWKFAVLVVPKTMTTWKITAIESGYGNHDWDTWHANKPIKFSCESAANSHVESTLDGVNHRNRYYVWDFGDNSTGKTNEPFVEHVYGYANVTKNYLVTCDVKDNGMPLKVWKSISIVPPDCPIHTRNCK
ncbi:hypothetical protein [Candidatus Nitrosotenuis chungbukensis]|uniref:hypothetical protein n=2 Tax=Candidatus Nitrosotenuis chungbukensis TaxID=1353246 RepID=UPI0012FF141C|nr:hypothetical protein [Candidatus Nitrosotenuis chungbukensis]